ncbi:MAG: RNA polymerase sigma factor [Chloroflexi bacterium]|nr:MAG: RNA polymerase sigma factor [Chloroflexota bacterium]
MVALMAIEPLTNSSNGAEDISLPELQDTENVGFANENPGKSEQQALVARALQGEQEAFNDIVNQYSSLMLRTANMVVGDRDIAEDVVQDALIQVWQHLPALRDAGALRSWLTRIVVNQCISFKRRLARSTAFIRQSLADQETNILAQVADDHKGRMERDWDLAQAIKNLPVKQRTVIVLHYYSGMTLPEMTQTLRISENTLKKRIQAALSNLRRTLRASDMDDAYAPTSTRSNPNRFAMSPA